MSDSKSNGPSLGRYRRGKFCATVIICAATIIMLGYHYRFHLLWFYARHRLELNTPIPFENRRMPHMSVPSTWVRHTIEEMELSLPPEFHTTNAVMYKNEARRYQYEAQNVIISPPEDYSHIVAWVYAASNMHPRHSTLPKLQYECYQTASTKFNWAMSPSDVRQYTLCAIYTKMYRIFKNAPVELLFRNEIDGMAIIDGNRVTFQWQCKNTSLGGVIHFYNGDGIEITDAGNDWIRAVCQSLRIIDSKAID